MSTRTSVIRPYLTGGKSTQFQTNSRRARPIAHLPIDEDAHKDVYPILARAPMIGVSFFSSELFFQSLMTGLLSLLLMTSEKHAIFFAWLSLYT